MPRKASTPSKLAYRAETDDNDIESLDDVFDDRRDAQFAVSLGGRTPVQSLSSDDYLS